MFNFKQELQSIITLLQKHLFVKTIWFPKLAVKNVKYKLPDLTDF